MLISVMDKIEKMETLRMSQCSHHNNLRVCLTVFFSAMYEGIA